MNAAPCPFCGQAARLLLEAACQDLPAAPPFALHRCAPCDAAFVHPAPGAEVLASLYPENYCAGRGLGGYQARRIAGLRDPGRVLDVGCGGGHFLEAMRRRGWEVRGVEPSAGARGHLPSSLASRVHPDLEALGDTRFDVITLWHVLEHLPDPAAQLARLRPRLKPDGLLFLALPNLDSWEREAFGGDWFHLDLPRHLFCWGPEGLRRLLDRQGYEVRQVDHFAWPYNAFGLYQSLLNRLGSGRDAVYRRLRRGRSDASLLPSLLLTPLIVPLTLALCLPLGILGRSGTFETLCSAKP